MKSRKSLTAGVLAASLGASLGALALPALAGDDCDVPVQHWQSREAVRRMAAQKGWEVQRLKIDDGCYEIRGRDAQGRSFEAKIDPQTLQVVKTKSRDRDRDRKCDERDKDRAERRSRDARGAAPQAGQPPGAASASAGPLFTPGSAPRGRIE